MKFDPAAIKAYDIRGVVPDQLDAAGAEQLGRAFAAYLQPTSVVVGRDGRTTSPEFQAQVIEGLTRSGVNVVDIGQASTDVFYYACATRDLPGIMVTASHNPPEYNGFKMIKKIPQFVTPAELKPYLLERSYSDAPKRGTVEKADVVEAFLDHLLTIVPTKSLRPLTVVVDTSSGMQGPIWERLIKRLPITVIPLFWEPDGSFPYHGNDVIQPTNQEPLRQKVLETGADLGLIFDPDGDRCLLMDDRGVTVPGDFITALLAVSLLKRQPGSAIVYDVRASDAVPDMVKQAGGKPVVWRVGHSLIKPKMVEQDAVFGGEVSGHFYFKDFWFCDCGLLSGLTMIAYASQLPGKLSEAIMGLEAQYHLSGEINSRVGDVPATLERIRTRYADAKLGNLDGLEVRYPDWRFVVRPSNTEPLLRLTLEADSEEKMAAKRDEVLELIREAK